MIDDLGAALRRKEISSVELTRTHLARLDKTKLVARLTRERAEAEARNADAEIAAGRVTNKPLLGIPYAVRAGFDDEATVVRRLADAGAVHCATLVTNDEASVVAAAVAASLVPFAIDVETTTNIVTESAAHRVAGLRPTYGAVSRHGATPLAWTLDKIGPICRTAADCNTVERIVMGEDDLDPTTANIFPAGRARWMAAQAMTEKPLRIGVFAPLRLPPHTIVPIALPPFPYEDVIATIFEAEHASASDRDSAILAVDYLRAMRIRAKIRAALLKLFEDIDAIVAPATHGTLLAAGNLAGAPAVSVAGLQFMTAPANDTTALNLAIHYKP